MKLRGKDTLSALQFKLLSYDFFLAPRIFTEVPFLVAMVPKTLRVKISSYLQEEFTQRLLLSQKSEKKLLVLKSAGFRVYIQKLDLVSTQGHKFVSALLGSIASWLFLPHYHIYTDQTQLDDICTPTFTYQQGFFGPSKRHGNTYFNDSFNQIQDGSPSNLIAFNL